jgi:queuosine precursor transporter
MNDPSGYRYFHIVSMLFVTTVLVSTTLVVKLVTVFHLTLTAAIIVFPLSYLFGDVLTEVYGYRRTREIIWYGFLCLAIMAVFLQAGIALPPASIWSDQPAFARIFENVPRTALSGFIAYLVGEFLNSAVLSRLKVATDGRMLWLRLVLSTAVGQGADSLVFCLSAFAGRYPLRNVLLIALSAWALKTLYEIVALPLTYRCVRFLKRAEGIDTFDREISYSPFARA